MSWFHKLLRKSDGFDPNASEILKNHSNHSSNVGTGRYKSRNEDSSINPQIETNIPINKLESKESRQSPHTLNTTQITTLPIQQHQATNNKINTTYNSFNSTTTTTTTPTTPSTTINFNNSISKDQKQVNNSLNIRGLSMNDTNIVEQNTNKNQQKPNTSSSSVSSITTTVNNKVNSNIVLKTNTEYPSQSSSKKLNKSKISIDQSKQANFIIEKNNNSTKVNSTNLQSSKNLETKKKHKLQFQSKEANNAKNQSVQVKPSDEEDVQFSTVTERKLKHDARNRQTDENSTNFRNDKNQMNPNQGTEVTSFGSVSDDGICNLISNFTETKNVNSMAIHSPKTYFTTSDSFEFGDIIQSQHGYPKTMTPCYLEELKQIQLEKQTKTVCKSNDSAAAATPGAADDDDNEINKLEKLNSKSCHDDNIFDNPPDRQINPLKIKSFKSNCNQDAEMDTTIKIISSNSSDNNQILISSTSPKEISSLTNLSMIINDDTVTDYSNESDSVTIHQDNTSNSSNLHKKQRSSDNRSRQKPKSSSGVANRKEGLFFKRPDPVTNDQIVTKHLKDEITSNLILKAIENNDFLNNYMDDQRKRLVIDAMEPRVYEKGKYIIRENEEGSEIFVSEYGVFEVIKGNEVIGTLGAGVVFGELAILYNAKRFASIKTGSKAKVWKIERSKFRAIFVHIVNREREENLKFLKSAPWLENLQEEVLNKVVDLLDRRFFPTNTCILRQGQKGDDFYIIRGGTVTVKQTNVKGEEITVNRLKRGDYFGERALLYTERRQASIYADPPGTECLKLDRVSFISYLGTIPELNERRIQPNFESQIIPSLHPNPYDHIELKDLKKITSLGSGAFGRVDLMLYKNTRSFALKVIKKSDVIKQGQVDHIYNEKNVMAMCHSPFIVELYNTYRDSKYIYFLMEACLGGDVWTIMYQKKYFEEDIAKFISGCVVLAFEYLHSRNIIFRDLKPENLMLTTAGYCKLVDFGFAKHLNPNYKTNTFAGTPEYVAPEIIQDRGHDRAVDYWALGILIYELLIGRTPFRGQTQMKIYQQILGGIEARDMPTRIPKSAQVLIKGLCRQMPTERLGCQRKGVIDIKKHSWYDGFNWDKLQKQTMSSPIKRPVNSLIDTQYFPAKFETDADIPPDENSGWDVDF